MVSRHLYYFGGRLNLVLEEAVIVDVAIPDCFLVDFVLGRHLGNRRDRPRISDVEQIKVIVDNQDHYCTRARFVVRLVWGRGHQAQEVLLCFI